MKRRTLIQPGATLGTTSLAAKALSPFRSTRWLGLFAAFASGFAQAGTVYWDGTGISWNAPASWSTSSSADTPDPGAVPGSTDAVVFNIDSESDAQAVALGANQAVSNLTVQGTATGGVALTGGGTDRTLSLGVGGIRILSGAGPVSIGSRTAGQGVAISMTGNQTWTNGSANAVTVHNGIGAPGAQTLTLRGAGGFQLNDASTFTGGLTTGAGTTLSIRNDNAIGSGMLTLGGGTLRVEDFPRTVTNKVLVSAAHTWAGNSALTLTGSGSAPALTLKQYVNPAVTIVNTAPIVISGVLSLLDAASGSNNGFPSPNLASSANLTISGPIQDNNAGNTGAPSQRPYFVFTGTGANLTLTGANGNRNSGTDVIVSSGTGYNTITIGGPGGPGATIKPFGASDLATNSGNGGQTFFLKPLLNGQILGNGISPTQSSNGTPIGFDGTNDLTLAGTFTLGASPISLANLATGTLTFSGTLNCVTNRILTLLGPGATVFSSTSVMTSSTQPLGGFGGFGKTGPGTLTLAGSNDLIGTTTLNGGTVILDYSATNASRLTAGTNTTAALTLGGVDLQLKGGSYAQTLGAGGGTTLGIGQSRVRRTAGGTSTLALGAITRGNGSLIDFEDGVATTTSGNTSGILGTGYATVGGTDWATVSGGTNVALATYGTFASPGTDQNVAHTGSASRGVTSIRTLKLVTSGSGQALTLSNTLTLNAGGLLFLGDNDYSISGSSIVYSGGLSVHHYGAGNLTINSALISGFVQKAGPGTLVLANAANSYTTMTYLLGGTVAVHANGCLGTGGLTLSGGTLQTTAGFILSKTAVLGANGGTFQVDTGMLEVTNVVSGSYGALTKTGAGTLLLAGANTYSGPTTVSAGTLKLGHDFGLGSSATNNNRSVSPVTVTGASTLDIAGRKSAIGNFTLADGTVADSVGGGTLGTYSFNLQNGSVSAVLTDVRVPNASNPSHSINLYKRTAGTVTLTATNSYSGTTFVEGGTLFVNGALTNSAAIVQAGGTLGGNGLLSRTVNVEGGTLAPGATNTQPGTLTLGRHLRIAGGTLRVGVAGSGTGQIVLTNPEAQVVLSSAVLDVAVLPGGGAQPELTIIDNQGANSVQGTFVGLPEGGLLDTGSRRYVVTYAGGSGNDVVLTMKQTATVIMIR